MRTAEEQHQYIKLCGELRRLALEFHSSLPCQAAYLRLHSSGNLVACDENWHMLAGFPNDETPSAFLEASRRLSENRLQDSDAIVATL